MLIAIEVVGAGLFITRGPARLLGGGLVIGTGVATKSGQLSTASLSEVAAQHGTTYDEAWTARLEAAHNVSSHGRYRP